MVKKEPYEKIKANVPVCALEGCNRIGVLKIYTYDMIRVQELPEGYYKESDICKDFCCKTHMIRFLQGEKMLRYSKKRAQRLAATMPLVFRPLAKKQCGDGI